MKNVYNQLYSSQNQQSAVCSSTFLENESLPAKLDDKKKLNNDPLLLKSWRPITFSNVDYKLATKYMAGRLALEGSFAFDRAGSDR